ncbi:hypothetical protein GQ457_08G032790 [Hibiscus cannabinus]
MTINVYNTIQYIDNGEECYSLQDSIDTTTADDTKLCYNRSIHIEDFMHLQEEDQEEVDDLPMRPKKGGMTVVTNEAKELLPTRTVTGWRICMDYRKLNKATKNDHFPLPFIN